MRRTTRRTTISAIIGALLISTSAAAGGWGHGKPAPSSASARAQAGAAAFGIGIGRSSSTATGGRSAARVGDVTASTGPSTSAARIGNLSAAGGHSRSTSSVGDINIDASHRDDYSGIPWYGWGTSASPSGTNTTAVGRHAWSVALPFVGGGFSATARDEITTAVYVSGHAHQTGNARLAHLADQVLEQELRGMLNRARHDGGEAPVMAAGGSY